MSTLTLHVSASADDADETNEGKVSITAKTSQFIGGETKTNKKYWGLRFQNVTIPNKATIQNVTLKAWVTASTNFFFNIVCFQAADSAAAFTTGAKNISSREKTKHKQVWKVASPAVGGYNSLVGNEELVGALQEVVNRAGWASGNAVAIIILVQTEGDTTVEDFDNLGTTEHSAVLEVEYTTGRIQLAKSIQEVVEAQAIEARKVATGGHTASVAQVVVSLQAQSQQKISRQQASQPVVAIQQQTPLKKASTATTGTVVVIQKIEAVRVAPGVRVAQSFQMLVEIQQATTTKRALLSSVQQFVEQQAQVLAKLARTSTSQPIVAIQAQGAQKIAKASSTQQQAEQQSISILRRALAGVTQLYVARQSQAAQKIAQQQPAQRVVFQQSETLKKYASVSSTQSFVVIQATETPPPGGGPQVGMAVVVIATVGSASVNVAGAGAASVEIARREGFASVTIAEAGTASVVVEEKQGYATVQVAQAGAATTKVERQEGAASVAVAGAGAASVSEQGGYATVTVAAAGAASVTITREAAETEIRS